MNAFEQVFAMRRHEVRDWEGRRSPQISADRFSELYSSHSQMAAGSSHARKLAQRRLPNLFNESEAVAATERYEILRLLRGFRS